LAIIAGNDYAKISACANWRIPLQHFSQAHKLDPTALCKGIIARPAARNFGLNNISQQYIPLFTRTDIERWKAGLMKTSTPGSSKRKQFPFIRLGFLYGSWQ
jgi:hypothetical protein